MTGTEPSFLLHPLDLLGGDQVPELAFFPGMDVSSQKKVKLFHKVLGEFAGHFCLVPMGTQAQSVCENGEIRVIQIGK